MTSNANQKLRESNAYVDLSNVQTRVFCCIVLDALFICAFALETLGWLDLPRTPNMLSPPPCRVAVHSMFLLAQMYGQVLLWKNILQAHVESAGQLVPGDLWTPLVRVCMIGIHGYGPFWSAETLARSYKNKYLHSSPTALCRRLRINESGKVLVEGYVLGFVGLTAPIVSWPMDAVFCLVMKARLAAAIAVVHERTLDDWAVGTAVQIAMGKDNVTRLQQMSQARKEPNALKVPKGLSTLITKVLSTLSWLKILKADQIKWSNFTAIAGAILSGCQNSKDMWDMAAAAEEAFARKETKPSRWSRLW